jgi:tetrahydromethanopterin S-methyltransferase subunit G
MSLDEVSLGEIKRVLDRIDKTVAEMRSEFVPQILWDESRKHQGERIGAIEVSVARLESAVVKVQDEAEAEAEAIRGELAAAERARQDQQGQDRRMWIGNAWGLAVGLLLFAVGALTQHL